MRTIYLGLAVATLFASVGCNKYVVRDHNVYATEVAFTNQLVRTAATSIEALWSGKCVCADGAWTAAADSGLTAAQCSDAADVVLIVQSDRWAWHSAMALVNAGWELGEIDPPEGFNPEAAPDIPPSSSLCPPTSTPPISTEGGE
jgi:hypothetical protein